MPVRDADEPSRHLLEALLAEVDLRQRIFAMGIEAGGDQKHFRVELVELRDDARVEGFEIFRVAGAWIERDVEREPAANVIADFPVVPAAGIARIGMLMQADEDFLQRRGRIKGGRDEATRFYQSRCLYSWMAASRPCSAAIDPIAGLPKQSLAR